MAAQVHVHILKHTEKIRPVWIVKSPDPHHHFIDVKSYSSPRSITIVQSFDAPGIESVSTIEAVPPCCLRMGNEPSVVTTKLSEKLNGKIMEHHDEPCKTIL